MSYQIPTTEPDVLVAGDLWTWTRGLADFPATDGWVLTYRIITAAADLLITASQDGTGTGFLVSVPLATTASVPAGTYRWFAYVTNAGGTERYSVDEGYVAVLADPATVSATAATTDNSRILALIVSAIEGRITSDHESYTIGDRAINKIPVMELQKLRGIYETLVGRERGQRRGLIPVRAGFGPLGYGSAGAFRQDSPWGRT